MRAYRVAYDGRDRHGFQRQPDVPTVEDRLLDALATLGVTDGDVPSGYAAAGRTDAGASALAQTVAFAAPAWLDPAAFNSELPPEIRVWAQAPAPSDFHATHDATAREYTYVCDARGAWDDEAAAGALARLAGEHDFHNLTPDDTGTVRTLETTSERHGEFVHLGFRAGGFPRQLVRRLVTVVSAVARGEATLARIDRLLGAAPLDGPAGVGPAPASPLVLTDVTYPDLAFESSPAARDTFAERHREFATVARVQALLDGR